MKKIFCVSLLCCAMMLLSFANVALAQPKAISVPWQPSNPSIPHYTSSGAEITLKGIARNLTGGGTYEWDFGDGTPVSGAVLITDPYNLGVKHTYIGAVGTLIIATLTVTDSLGTSSDNYPVKIYESSDLSNPDHLDVRINMAIDEGLWNLHTTLNRATYAAGSPGYEQPYGYWNDYYAVAAGAAVDAFQLHGSKVNTDYDKDPYVETVQRALNYLLTHTYSYPIGPQTYGDPDTNGNGIGLVTNWTNNLTDYSQTYIGGICMVALASSGAPNRVASVGGPDVYGRTYAEIVQDMVDFFAWGQVDSDWGRGGWRYYANFTESDMSTAQWPPLGMLAAEENMGSTVPDFVRSELEIYLTTAQNTALNNDNGAFAYFYPGYADMYDIPKAAAGIIGHEFLKTPLDDPRVQSAIGFIYRHWNDTGTGWDYTRLLGNSYGMYGLMKAMRIPQPDILHVTEYDYTTGLQTSNSFDWYYTPAGQTQEGMASYIVSTQQADGSWDDNVGFNQVYDAFATGWRILILLKGVTIIPPNAVISDCDEQEYEFNQEINLSGADSYHQDIKRNIVTYEWDLDNDGEFDDATGVTATIPLGLPPDPELLGYYHPVSLRVTDDNPESAQTDTATCQIYVHSPPHCPHAFSGGPYLGWVGDLVTFDASASWDPNNDVLTYAWDLDNDGDFDDASGINPTWIWTEEFFGVIGLKVTDNPTDFDPCSDIDYTTVEIGNHAPVSDPNGPYPASPDSCISLDGAGSYDPDAPGGDTITHAWDLDNDGEYDNSDEVQPEFCVGPVIGTVYDICLKVTDSYGETDVQCTTVTIVPNQPPVADPNGPYLGPLYSCFDGTGSTDPDGDSLTYSWDFGDGNTSAGETPCNTYTEARIYDVCLTVNDGTVDSEEVCTIAVVYDPDAGFVTGGGWIDSPTGAYIPDPTLTGKANFGFVAKYKKGANVPTGQTEFQFQTAGLNFHSSSYQWLVVTGNNYAKFKGSGTINGEGDFKFMLWAGDNEPDTFRIKIWEEDEFDNEIDIYDNGFDLEIGGGAIVIHVKK